MSDAKAARWLLKTEPSTYSGFDLEKDEKTVWDGVRNPVALKNLAQFRKGDRAFIYHTGDEKAVVAIARVVTDAYADSRPGHEPLPIVDLAFEKHLENPVSLKRIKADDYFSDFALVKLPRLSVMPVTEEQWDRVVEMARVEE